jgi:signal transduction histidine kinase
VRAVVDTEDGPVAHVAVPARIDTATIALVAVHQLDDASEAVGVVRRAFIVAATISFGIALLLGLWLARRLVRRLRALRDAALRVSELGPVVEMQADDAPDEVGDLTRALVTMQDRLRAQEQARRAFVATASHELRTPLASLRMILDLLRDDLDRVAPDVGDARAQAQRAEEQAERLATLAANLLNLSRIDAGLPARSELTDVAEIARAVSNEFGPQIASSGGELKLGGDPQVWAIADPDAVAQIVRILIDNALRHGPPGGAVRVETASAGGRPSIAVRDAGDGVPAGERDRIFERFERGSAAAGTTPGFGLGLAIARELARRMGGEVALDPDPATTFRLSLPVAPEPPSGDTFRP